MNVCYIYYMSFFSNINVSPIDTLRNKIEHVASNDVLNMQKTDDSLVIAYTIGKYTDVTYVEIPYNWLINEMLSMGLDINNIDKIKYGSLFSFSKKNNQLIRDLYLTFYEKDEIVKTMLLSKLIEN